VANKKHPTSLVRWLIGVSQPPGTPAKVASVAATTAIEHVTVTTRCGRELSTLKLILATAAPVSESKTWIIEGKETTI
jgi:hypothetical protein